MKDNETKFYNFPSFVLLALGIIDLVRGLLHTFNSTWAATTFARLNLSVAKDDQLFLLSIFGISNILTGLIYILISQKAKFLSPYILIIIPTSYSIGYLGLKLSNINSGSTFYGRYFMLAYFGACIVTAGVYFLKKH